MQLAHQLLDRGHLGEDFDWFLRSDRAHTFDTFVRTIGAWWP